MRIIIDATASVSGGELYIHHIINWLAVNAVGHEIIIYIVGGDEKILRDNSSCKIVVNQIKIPMVASRDVFIEGVFKTLWRQIMLPIYILRNKPDILLSNAGALPLCVFGKVKTIIAIHNSMPFRPDLIGDEKAYLRRVRLKLLRRILERSLSQCNAAIVFSMDTIHLIKRILHDIDGRAHLIYHGVDWGERERGSLPDLRYLSELGIKQPYLLFVSHFHRYKNIEGLVRAFSIISERHPDISLVLAGDTGDQGYWSEIEGIIEDKNLLGKVIHVSKCQRDRLVDIYNGAQIFVHPSLAETCSFPLLEAMALGLPVAAARASALPEIAGDAAVYFDPDDEHDMADAIDRLLTDEKLRDELRARAVDRAAGFTWEEAGRRTLEVIREVAGRP